MKSIKIIWANGDVTYTSINGTDREIENYYIGKFFNIGNGAKGFPCGDLMVKCIDVKFL